MTSQESGATPARERRREQLVAQLREQGIQNEQVLQAMLQTPRHDFVSGAVARRAYEDNALPIGFEQTISQPYIVALMTQALLGEEPLHKVLEIGTGSGYQSAVLSHVAERVYSVERIPQLHRKSARLLHDLGYRNVLTRKGDGTRGWNSQAPFDAIMVTAAAAVFPETLAQQLRVGGRMVIPEGYNEQTQILVRYIQTDSGLAREEMLPVCFVPLVGD